MIILLSALAIVWTIILIGMVLSAIRKDAKQVGVAYILYDLLKRKMK